MRVPPTDEENFRPRVAKSEAALILARVQKKPARARVCAPHPHWNEKKELSSLKESSLWEILGNAHHVCQCFFLSPCHRSTVIQPNICQVCNPLFCQVRSDCASEAAAQALSFSGRVPEDQEPRRKMFDKAQRFTLKTAFSFRSQSANSNPRQSLWLQTYLGLQHSGHRAVGVIWRRRGELFSLLPRRLCSWRA